MYFAGQLFLITSIICAIFLLIGLFKPWMMLWWEDIQNRTKVIKLYGSMSAVSFCIYLIIILTQTNPQ